MSDTVAGDGGRETAQASLEVDSVSCRFGGLQALDNVSFSARRGTVTALVGPNGAGKTTLLNIISGVRRADRGAIRVHGRAITQLSPNKVCQLGVARTFQDMRLFDHLTVLENVIVGQLAQVNTGLLPTLARLRRSHMEWRRACDGAEELLASVDLQDHRIKTPPELSYGMCRRLDIARAIATSPKILLLDEPTSGVRAREIAQLERLIVDLAERGRTVLLVEHNMQVVTAVAPAVVVLNFGRKIGDGETATVLRQQHVIDAYLGKPVDETGPEQ